MLVICNRSQIYAIIAMCGRGGEHSFPFVIVMSTGQPMDRTWFHFESGTKSYSTSQQCPSSNEKQQINTPETQFLCEKHMSSCLILPTEALISSSSPGGMNNDTIDAAAAPASTSVRASVLLPKKQCPRLRDSHVLNSRNLSLKIN